MNPSNLYPYRVCLGIFLLLLFSLQSCQNNNSHVLEISLENALSTFELEDGFQIELIAGEPLISDPVDMDMDMDDAPPIPYFGIHVSNDFDGLPSPMADFHFFRGGATASDFVALDSSGMVVSSSGALSTVPEPSSTLLISAIMSAGMLFRFRPRR